MYDGSCLCGGVKYRINGDIESTSNCHCTMCQKQHGAAFASYGNVPSAVFSFLEGAELVTRFRSSDSVIRTFCKRCGSNLTWHNEAQHGNYISVALGTLDTEYAGPVTKEIYTDTRVRWLPQNKL